MRQIDLQTTQNVTIEYDLATLPDRLMAFVVDVVVVPGAYLILAAILLSDVVEGWSATVAFGFFPLFLFLGYYFLSQYLSGGTTIGKRALNIRVVKLDEEEPAALDYFLRTILLLVDGGSFGIVGSLLITGTVKRQRLGDLAANTSVIKIPKVMPFRLEDILRISTKNEYEPQFPQVQQLKEADMLFIKRLIQRYRSHPNEAHRQAVVKTVRRIETVLGVSHGQRSGLEFLTTLLKDYIVLTR